MSGCNAQVAKLSALLKAGLGPFGTHANKTSKGEMYSHFLETFRPGDWPFSDRKLDFAFDWNMEAHQLTDDFIFNRVTHIATYQLSAGSDVKNTRWLSFLCQFPEYDPAWSADEMVFDHYVEVLGKDCQKTKAEDGN